MSRRRKIVRRISGLRDLQDIVTVMKHLAMIEIAKLSRANDTRREMIELLGKIVIRFLHAYPDYARRKIGLEILLAIGSERGFCGDFNENVARALMKRRDESGECYVIVVGRRLLEHLAPSDVHAVLEGANSMEDIDDVLTRILQELTTAMQHVRGTRIAVQAISQTVNGVEILPITPFRENVSPGEETARRSAAAPEIQIAPDLVFDGLYYAYMDTALNEMLSASLIAENRARLERMNGASRHIDERTTRLNRTAQRLRQEEITGEIEIIELSTTG